MISIKELINRAKRGPSDLVSLDLSTTSVKALRMKKAEGGGTILAAGILPGVPIPAPFAEASERIEPLELPKNLRGKYACITIPGHGTVVKLLSFPGNFGAKEEAQLSEQLGLEEPEKYRIGYKLITSGKARSETKVLAVATPENVAAALCQLLPAGIPAPYSIELSGLAGMSALLQREDMTQSNSAIGAIAFGDEISYLALFHDGALALVRKFDLGTNTILNKIRQSLGVDLETAKGILADGSFDISQPVSEATDPFLKQLVISRDFVERRENCHVSKIYASGSILTCNDWTSEIKKRLGLDVEAWNPMEGLSLTPNAIPSELVGREFEFSSAIGAALGAFEES